LKGIRGNNGYLSRNTYSNSASAVRQFLNYVDIPISNHAINDLVTYKKANPQSVDIEQAVRAFALEEPLKCHATNATRLLGIFRANFAKLNVTVNTHFSPAEENCTEGTFREIHDHLTPEQQDLIQWGIYVPERARATNRTPFSFMDFSRQDYAVVWIQSEGEFRSKARVKHPCFPPINFAKRIRTCAEAAGRSSPFPNHESLWKQITNFAKREYGVRLVSNYCRKFFEDKAEDSRLAPSLAAFIMGDKTKLAQTGHLPLVYNPKLKFVERMIENYKQSGLNELLDLRNSKHDEGNEVENLKRRIRELEETLARRG